jgi:hypothetical protein
MQTVDTHGTFDEAIAEASAGMQQIARALRALILKLYPDVVEVPWPKQQITGYGVGPKKMTEHFCYIAPQREYVNLGFYYGAHLSDPKSLLEGTGKNLRHIKVRDVEMVEDSAVREMIEHSIEERQQVLSSESE